MKTSALALMNGNHSNIHALEAICAQEGERDQIYCTSDLVDYGPFPREVLA